MTDTVRARVPSPIEGRPSRAPAGVEANGLNVIPEQERHGRPAQLFWPWFGANVSVLGLSYGSFVLGFGVSFVQASVVGVVGIVLSFLFCGFVAVAGKRGSAPTLVFDEIDTGVGGAVADAIGARVVMPDYPLAPEHTWKDSHDALVDDAATHGLGG